MALFNFTGCTEGNNIGDIIVSADTNFSSGWTGTTLVTLYDKNTLIPSVSGMCYTWDFTTASTGNADFIVTNENQYAETEDCSRCDNTYSIRVTGCTGQGTWIIGSNVSQLSNVYSEGDFIYISYPSLNGCFEVISDGEATQNIFDEGDVAISGPHTSCSDCLNNHCNLQDVVILLDQSSSIAALQPYTPNGQQNFDLMLSGASVIATELKDKMDLGEIQIGLYKWSNCYNFDLITGLTSNYVGLVNLLTGGTINWDGGQTRPSSVINEAYELLTGSTNPYSDKNIILITDGALNDFTTPPSSCPSTTWSTTEICNQLKGGSWGNGEVVKIYTVNISGGNNDQLNSLSSGEDFSFTATTITDFVEVAAPLIAASVCNDTPGVGEGLSYYSATTCSSSNTIVVSIDSGYTVNLNYDGFIYNGDCYEFTSVSLDENYVYLVYTGDVISNSCVVNCVQTNPTPTPTSQVTPTAEVTPTSEVTPTAEVTPTSDVTPTPVPSGTPDVTQTPQVTPTITPTTSQPETCYIGTTNGIFQYVDCCGVVRNGNSVGQSVCVNPVHTYTGIILSTTECDTECNQGDLLYSFTISGTCLNSTGGTINIFPSGGVKPYTIQNNEPGTLPTRTTYDFFTYTGLTADTYTFTLNDSSGGINQSINININLEGCLSLSETSTNGSCGNNNGSLTISGDSYSFPYNYKLYRNSGLIISGLTSSNPFTINNLNGGDYYAIVTDYGGSSAQTSTYTISSGTSVDFGFTVTGSSSCNNNVGAASVTGVTGVSPFTYLWNDGQTGSTATGLTYGFKSVIVTDSSGCTKTKQVNIPQVESLGVASLTTTQANCFNDNGTATVTITGGTAPFLYSADTGYVSGYITNRTITLTGLNGNHIVRVLDSNFCDIQRSFNVPSTAGFGSVSINITNSQCSQNGSMTITVNNNTGLVNYSITGSTGNTQSVETTQQSYTFNNLPSDVYNVKVSSNGCDYTTTKTVTNVDKFLVTATKTDTSCGLFNGEVLLEVFTGSTSLQLPLDYIIRRVSDNQIVYQNIDSPYTSDTITNLAATTYRAIVTDINSCSVEKYFTINASNGVLATIQKTDCVNGDDGTAELIIFQGTPPFNITWSDNVNGQTGTSLSNLSGDTYYATIVDNNGCSLTVNTTIDCGLTSVSDYIVNNVCQQTMITSSGNKRSFYTMLNESFLDASNGQENCVLESAVFTMGFVLSSSTVSYNFSEDFYTGTTLTDVPSDNLWASTLSSLLSQITELKSYSVNLFNNTYTLISDCDGDEDPLRDAYVKLSLDIDIELNCISVTPLPPPSATPTRTPNQSPTPTRTLTPTVTPTNTVTPTFTPTETITPTPSLSLGTPTPTKTPGLTQPVTPTPTQAPIPKALLFILEQSNNLDFATYMYNNGSTFYGFGLDYAPTTDSDVTLFMDWPGWFDGTAPTVIETEIPQITGGIDTYGNLKTEYNFITTQVPKGTATDAWYIWLIPQSMLGGSDKRQTYIGYNINNSPNSLISQPMTSSIYQYGGSYTGSNWINDTYRMYTTHPGLAFSISTNDIRTIYFKGDTVE